MFLDENCLPRICATFYSKNIKNLLFVIIDVDSQFIIMSELLGSLNDYFVIESPSSVQTRNAYLYATGLSLPSLYSVCGYACHCHDGLILGMISRTMMLSAIYKKVYLLYSVSISDMQVCFLGSYSHAVRLQ